MHGIISTSYAAAFDDIVEQINHLPVQYAAYHVNLVTDKSVPNLSHPLLSQSELLGMGIVCTMHCHWH